MRRFAFAESGEGFVPPSTADFNLPPVFGNNEFTTKPILLVLFSVVLISVFFIIASRKAAVVPSKLQFAGESVYAFVRNGIGQEIIGHEFMRFVPFLFTLLPSLLQITFLELFRYFNSRRCHTFPSHMSWQYFHSLYSTTLELRNRDLENI